MFITSKPKQDQETFNKLNVEYICRTSDLCYRGHGVGVLKSSTTTFWDDVFEELDDAKEGLWVTCGKGLYVPTERTTLETI